MLPLGPAAYFSGLTTWPFMIDATLLHLYLCYTAYLFYKDNSNVSARNCFKATLYYLPIFIVLMLIHLNVAPEVASVVVEGTTVAQDVVTQAKQ